MDIKSVELIYLCEEDEDDYIGLRITVSHPTEAGEDLVIQYKHYITQHYMSCEILDNSPDVYTEILKSDILARVLRGYRLDQLFPIVHALHMGIFKDVIDKYWAASAFTPTLELRPIIENQCESQNANTQQKSDFENEEQYEQHLIEKFFTHPSEEVPDDDCASTADTIPSECPDEIQPKFDCVMHILDKLTSDGITHIRPYAYNWQNDDEASKDATSKILTYYDEWKRTT
jgi:hypothetical protein